MEKECPFCLHNLLGPDPKLLLAGDKSASGYFVLDDTSAFGYFVLDFSVCRGRGETNAEIENLRSGLPE